MLKKLMLAIITVTAFTAVASSAYADYYYCDNLQNIENPWYFNIGASAYYLQTPEFGTATASPTTSNALYKSNDDSLWTFMPSVALGYQFPNYFLTQIFGNQASVELDASYFNTGTQKSTTTNTSGYIWLINGSGNIPLPSAASIPSIQITSKFIYSNFGLYFRGDKSTANPYITTSPFVGLVYTHFNQNYDYGINYFGGTTNINQENVNEKTTTDYYGVGIGDQINYNVLHNLSLYARAELQLLNASTDFSGNEVNESSPAFNANAKGSNSKLTYRGILTAGASYTLTNFLTAPSINLEAGYDRWGYMPEVVNPRGLSDNRPADVKNDTSNNLFATISVHIPFG